MREAVERALDSFAESVPGFHERIAAGRPLRFALVRMMARAYDLGNDEADGLIEQWLRGEGLDAGPDPGVEPEVPNGLDQRLADLRAELADLAGSGTLEEAQTKMELATILHDLGRLDEALALSMAGRELLEKLEDEEGAAVATMEIGLTQLAYGWVDDAIGSLLSAKSVLEPVDGDDLSSVCINLGNALKRQGRPREALVQYEVAARLYAAAGDRAGEARARFNLAAVAMSLGRYERSLAGFASARQIYAQLDLPVEVADCDLAAGDVMLYLGNPYAINVALDALGRYEELGRPVEVAHACRVAGHIADHLGDHDLARRLAERAIDFYLGSSMWADAVQSLTALTYAKYALGDIEGALEALDRARQISERQSLFWNDEFDREMAEQIRNGSLPSHDHPNPDDVVDSGALVDEAFLEALRISAELHGSQRRKTGDASGGPSYVGHILTVAGQVIDSGGNREQAIAALLHDAVEDSVTSVNDIRLLFGEEVAELVEASTDAETDPKPPWRERKEAYLKHLESAASGEALLISASDKLHNARSMIRDHQVVGHRLWDRFNPDADPRWYYQEVARVLNQRLEDPIVHELSEAVSRLVEILDGE